MAVKRICGIDEAGRGPVVGPLVVAGVVFREDQVEKLRVIGVRDSKQLTPRKREVLAREILKICEQYSMVKVEPPVIDRYVFRNRLNLLEAKLFAELISRLKADVYVVDSADVNAERFKRTILNLLGNPNITLISEHKAESKWLVVAAASILAKVNRDLEIKKLEKRYGLEIGSGYPSDPKTIKFLKRFLLQGRKEPIIRESWETVKKLRKTLFQGKLPF